MAIFGRSSKWGQYTSIVVSPGSHTIGFERDIRTSDKFLHPDRQAPEPSLTTTIDVLPNQAYFLEICFIERDSRDFKKTAVFSETLRGRGRAKVGRFTKSQMRSPNLPPNTARPSSSDLFRAESAFVNRVTLVLIRPRGGRYFTFLSCAQKYGPQVYLIIIKPKSPAVLFFYLDFRTQNCFCDICPTFSGYFPNFVR